MLELSARRDQYAAWAQCYPPCAHNALMAAEQESMLELLPSVDDSTVLDAGCGSGRYTALLMTRGARRVIGVDVSPAMIARARAGGRPVVLGDLAALPIASASCGLIVSGLALQDLPVLDPVLREWARVLGPRGAVVYSALHPVGKALRWKRTYESPAGAGCLPSHWHSRQDHVRACAAAGLQIDAVREPRLSGSGPPVALVVRARRPT